ARAVVGLELAAARLLVAGVGGALEVVVAGHVARDADALHAQLHAVAEAAVGAVHRSAACLAEVDVGIAGIARVARSGVGGGVVRPRVGARVGDPPRRTAGHYASGRQDQQEERSYR